MVQLLLSEGDGSPHPTIIWELLGEEGDVDRCWEVNQEGILKLRVAGRREVNQTVGVARPGALASETQRCVGAGKDWAEWRGE